MGQKCKVQNMKMFKWIRLAWITGQYRPLWTG